MLPLTLLRTSLRSMLRRPWQIGLCILGVALGVAVVISIDLATTSANRAFTLSTEAITGSATHQIIDNSGGLDEALYRHVRVDLGLRQSAPIVRGYVSAPTLEDITLEVLGVDPIAEAPFRSFLSEEGADEAARNSEPVDVTALLIEPATVLMLEQTAERHGLGLGDILPLRVGTQQHDVRIIGLLRPQDDLSRRTLENLLICDIATAQELLDSVGTLSRIDLILPDETTDPVALTRTTERIQAILPPGAELIRPESRSDTLQQMTQAFELNLSALSLLALVVGMFLIYNTMTFNVIQRRELLGTLRCIGVTRRQLFALVLLEALIISGIGTLLGILLGIALGQGMLHLVTRTINDLYFVVTVSELTIDPLVLLKSIVLGLGAGLVAAAVPAREAMLSPPRTVQRRSSAEEQMQRIVPWATAGGVVLLMAGVLVILGSGAQTMPGEWAASRTQHAIVSAFAGLFLMILGCALLTPGATVALMLVLRPLSGRVAGLLGRMAARNVVATLSRTSVAVAALMVAVSVTIGVGTMVGSFRQTVINWLDQRLIADIYISPANNAGSTSSGPATTLDPAIIDAFVQTPGIIGRAFFRTIQAQTAHGQVRLMAVQHAENLAYETPLGFQQAGANPAEDLKQGAIFISEPLAYRTGLTVGDSLRIHTEQGARDFPIAAIYYDYTSDRGVIRMSYETYRIYWNDPDISSFALFTAPEANVDALVQQLREQAGGEYEVTIRSNRALRDNTLVVFDRTFAITAVLQMLATIIAFIGILSTLMALQLEQSRELAMLRANGLTPRQLWGLVLSQTSLMGLAAGLLAMPVGLMLALVLVFVINRRSFGWTLELSLDPWVFAQALLVALAAALLAGIYPALRMANTNPALALREE